MSFDLKIVNGDLSLGSNKDLAKVENSEKLIQDILKICITPVGSNPYNPWYGSALSKGLIGNTLDDRFLKIMGSSQISSVLGNLKSLQQEQARTSQKITASEHIAAVEAANIERSQTDLRFFRVSISVVSKALTRVNTGFKVGL
jgi:hypothetical protein